MVRSLLNHAVIAVLFYYRIKQPPMSSGQRRLDRLVVAWRYAKSLSHSGDATFLFRIGVADRPTRSAQPGNMIKTSNRKKRLFVSVKLGAGARVLDRKRVTGCLDQRSIYSSRNIQRNKETNAQRKNRRSEDGGDKEMPDWDEGCLPDLKRLIPHFERLAVHGRAR